MSFTSPMEMKFLKSIEKIREIRLFRAEREMLRSGRELDIAEKKTINKQDELNQTTADVATMMTELRQKYRQRSVQIKEFDEFIGGRSRGRGMVFDAQETLSQAKTEQEAASLKLEEAIRKKMQLAKQHEKMKWVIETNRVVQPE